MDIILKYVNCINPQMNLDELNISGSYIVPVANMKVYEHDITKSLHLSLFLCPLMLNQTFVSKPIFLSFVNIQKEVFGKK